MPLTDKARIAAERDAPRIVSLWQALTALRSTVSFMNTGAHPDDETSAMLAAMRFRDGIDISYACSTRGEGGQNDIGIETAAALGTLRTAEMEAACDRLDLRMYWLSVSPDDPITDFGFSKSGTETLGKWGHARTLARFVDILRTERPDIICPTFLDVPGQHGHHRAMTQAAHEVMTLAADPAFVGSDLPVWQVSKMYLPAWSGAGQAYDDDLPPPPATLTVPGKGRDPVTGWPYARIGQQSRVLHATQAMGRWVTKDGETDFPLHLAHSFVDGPDDTLGAGLVQTLRDFGLPELVDAQDACDAAIAAFPDADKVLVHAIRALATARAARKKCPPELVHKLARKETQLARVIHLAHGIDVRVAVDHDVLHPGDTTCWRTSGAGDAQVTPVLPDGWSVTDDQVMLAADANLSDPYPHTYLPDEPAAPCAKVSVTVDGVLVSSLVPFETTPLVIPKHSASVSPVAEVINLTSFRRSFEITVRDLAPATAQPGLQTPEGWQVATDDTRLIVTLPDDTKPGLYDLTLTLDGQPAEDVQYIRHAHVGPRALVRPAMVQVRVVSVQIPAIHVGYVGGGNDRVGLWLDRMGATVTDLSEVDLTEAALADIDTLVIGIFAMKFRPGLAQAMPYIHDWVRAGGTLLTLYHRPWDNWDPEATPVERIEIGQPSLRWRVTDETAPVTLLAPDHPAFHTPNKITDADWDGWHKERGLYFAKSWDAAYTPLIAMHDADEDPLQGALLAADVGQGRHIHTSLILHHQMEKMTPGAFAIMANLLAKRG